MSIFRERFKELLEDNNLGYRELSRLSGIANSKISSWLRYDVTPTTKSIIQVAKYFECPVDFLLGRTENDKTTFSNNPVTFAERLKELIGEKSITPYRACMELHIETAMMSDWTNNSTLPAYDNLILLAEYFNCSADYLLGISDNK